MIFRTVTTTAALAIMLAVIGAVAGPQWDPTPVADHIRPETENTAVGGQATTTPIGTYKVRQSDVSIQLDGQTVDGRIREPVGAPGDVPAVVFVHGAGTGSSKTAFRTVATDLASAGITTLVPSKRLDNYSTRHRDYEQMALDYAHSVDFIRLWPGVNAAEIGVYAESEGTWIAPVMAVNDPLIGFLVMVSSPVVPPRQQAAFAVDSYLRNTEVPHGVFRAIPRAVGMAFPGGGFEYADFEVKPFLAKVTAPMFVVYGTADASMPVEQGAEEIIDVAQANMDPGVTVRYYKGANHGIKVDDELVPAFPRDLSAWIALLPASAKESPQVAGAQPNQQFLALPVPSPAWYGNGDPVMFFVLLGVGLLVFGALAWPVVALVSRLRGRRTSSRLARGVRGPLTGLGVGALATMLGLVIYLFLVARLALNYERDSWVVQGGWVAVRLLGLATVVAGALIVNRWRELHSARRRIVGAATGRGRATGTTRHADLEPGAATRIAVGVPAQLAFWAVVLGSTVVLLTLAYWGVYQLGI